MAPGTRKAVEEWRASGLGWEDIAVKLRALSDFRNPIDAASVRAWFFRPIPIDRAVPPQTAVASRQAVPPRPAGAPSQPS